MNIKFLGPSSYSYCKVPGQLASKSVNFSHTVDFRAYHVARINSDYSPNRFH
jgi:hypothetical protein